MMMYLRNAGWLVAVFLLALSTSAEAQNKGKPKKTEAGQQAVTLTPAERTALAPVQAAITAKDWAAAQSGLAAARAAVTSPDGRYAIGRFELEIGLGLEDVALQRQGLANLVASGQVAAADLPLIYRNQGVLANNAGDLATAERAFAEVARMSPNDAEALISLAQVKSDLKKSAEAVSLIRRAIELRRASGQKADEGWYKYALKLAFDGRQDPNMSRAAQDLSQALVTVYPSKDNWRDAVLIYRDTAELDPAADLDVLRFMRASGSLAGERDWYDLAEGLYKAENYAEAKAALDDGIARGIIDPRKAAFAEVVRLTDARMTGDLASLEAGEGGVIAGNNGAMALKYGDAFHGYGQAARAVRLFRAALAKGGADPSLVQTRLGMALLASGDRDGAEAAFRKLTGPRQQLGAFWLAWLARSP